CPELSFWDPFARLSPWCPRLLAIRAGVSLLALAARHDYYVPSLHHASTPFGAAVAIIEGALGVWLVTGGRIRPAALALVSGGPLGMFFYGVVPILERMDLLGVALFLVLLEAGSDRMGGASTDPHPRERETIA